MIKNKNYCGPFYGGLFVEKLPYFPIRERENKYKAEVITQDEALDIVVTADLTPKSRFKGAKDGIIIRQF